MAFISLNRMQELADEATVQQHPLLQESADISSDIKLAYVQGCALAVMLDDAKIDDVERRAVRRVGLSLGLKDPDLSESVATVEKIPEDGREAFVKETLNQLKNDPVRRYFIVDFEALVRKDGALSAESAQYVEAFGRILYGSEDWRTKCSSKGESEEEKQLEQPRESFLAGLMKFAGELSPDPNATFRLVMTSGGENHDSVSREIVKMTSMSEYDARIACWSTRHVLRNDLCYKTAKEYKERLEACGASVILEQV